MDYQALGLGEAPSVVTAVRVVEDEHAISISCLYDPQGAQRLYKLCFTKCTHIAWEPFDDDVDPHQLDAELIGISLETSGPQKRAVITTDVFELSFSYGSFVVQTHTSTSYSSHL
jgi:hypothetical protein